MELRQLRYVVCVADTLHFGQAAQRLHVVPSAVSQQVARLERELGVSLFERSSRTVRLTAAGTHFLPYAQRVLDAQDNASDTMALWQETHARTVVVGSSAGLGDRVGRILATLDRQEPTMSMDLRYLHRPERLAQVRNGTLDAAFLRGESGASTELDLTHVWDDEVVIGLPEAHPLAADEDIDLGDLAELPLRIVPRAQNPDLFDPVHHACARTGVAPVLGAAFTTLEETFAAVPVGEPTWTVFYRAHANLLAIPGIAFRGVRGSPLLMPTHLVTAAHRRITPPISRLIDICRAN